MIVLEIQKYSDTLAQLVTVHSSRAEAEQKYHVVLAAAAVSSVPVHSAVMLSDTGDRIKGETYYHEEAQA